MKIQTLVVTHKYTNLALLYIIKIKYVEYFKFHVPTSLVSLVINKSVLVILKR